MRFITFEGIDGAGKGVQIGLLSDHLRNAGISLVNTREPGGTPAAEKIREGLLSGAFKEYGALAEVMMFNAARAHHLADVIRPALACGQFVICDRFFDSTLAYQGAGGRVDPTWIKSIQAAVVGTTIPDLTFILDVPVDISLARLKARGGDPDRFEGAGRQFQVRLRQAYLDIAKSDPTRCRLIDGTQSIEQVHQEILEATRLANFL